MSSQIGAVGNINNGAYKDMPDVVYNPKVGDTVLSAIADSEDVAILIALGYKYDGRNSQFAKMACRMLNIDSIWTDK